MRARAVRQAITALAMAATAATAQTPNFSGTWKLNKAASQIDPAATLVGLGGNVGTPQTLYITQAANGTLIIGSDTNTSHARTYKPGHKTVSPLGRGGELAIVSRWEGGVLVAEAEDASSGSRINESVVMNADGSTLTVSISATRPDGERSSRLVYTKTLVEAPCSTWPTPCETR